MNTAVLVPISIVLISGLVLQLYGIAQNTSDKVVVFATDADNAVDCAIRGVPIQECSPDLLQAGTGVQELAEFSEFNQQLIQNLSPDTRMTLMIEEGEGFTASLKDSIATVKVVSLSPQRQIGVLDITTERAGSQTVANDIVVLGSESMSIDIDGDDDADILLKSNQIRENQMIVSMLVLRGTVLPMQASIAIGLAVGSALLAFWYARDRLRQKNHS
jgi:hypothetical protein